MDEIPNLGGSTGAKPSIAFKFKRIFRKPNLRSRNSKILFSLILVLIILGIAFTIPALAVYTSVKSTSFQAKKAIDALKKQNISLAQDELKKTREQLKETQGKYRLLSVYKFFPILGGYISDGDHAI